MKKKLLRKISLISTAAVLCVGASAAFTGCTTDNPEITITYEFNGKEYNVDYVLSRKSAPQTVQHFIELADLGYYEGLCIHDYSSSYLYSGGYTYDEATKALTEKDYFTAVKDKGLTQSVFLSKGGEGLNTLYGEFSKNGVSVEGNKYTHQKGALVMYYNEKGSDCNERVVTRRNDGGKDNEGDEYQENSEYRYNCATSLFYTYLSQQNADRDSKYCVFGLATNYEEQMEGDDGLLTAISEYTETLDDDGFTEEQKVILDSYDPFASVRDDKNSATYEVPVKPIVIKAVKVNKY